MKGRRGDRGETNSCNEDLHIRIYDLITFHEVRYTICELDTRARILPIVFVLFHRYCSLGRYCEIKGKGKGTMGRTDVNIRCA